MGIIIEEKKRGYTMQTLAQDIKENRFKPVYLLYGEEVFLKNSYKNQLKASITQGDTVNFNQFE